MSQLLKPNLFILTIFIGALTIEAECGSKQTTVGPNDETTITKETIPDGVSYSVEGPENKTSTLSVTQTDYSDGQQDTTTFTLETPSGETKSKIVDNDS